MDRERAIQFCRRYAHKEFYQPIVFIPGIIEIQGKWNEATKDLVSMVLPDCSGKTVLDLGCMHGFFLYEALKRGAKRAVGIDHDVAEMAVAQEIKEIMDMPVELFHEKIEEYQPDQQFDIVLMMNITHVLSDPKETTTKFLDVAKELLVVEYRPGHESLFPREPDRMCDSLRSAGYRKLAFFTSPHP